MTDELQHIELLKSKRASEAEQGFKFFFEKYYPQLRAYALVKTRSLEEAQDAVQEVFRKLWDNRARVREEEYGLKPYLFKILTSDLINKHRRQGYEQKYLDHIQWLEDMFLVSGDQSIALTEIKQIVDDCVGSLPPQASLVLRKSRIEGKTKKEITEEMGIAEKTFEGHLTKALRVLRDALKDYLVVWILFFIL